LETRKGPVLESHLVSCSTRLKNVSPLLYSQAVPIHIYTAPDLSPPLQTSVANRQADASTPARTKTFKTSNQRKTNKTNKKQTP
jgi:hypothetical protein